MKIKWRWKSLSEVHKNSMHKKLEQNRNWNKNKDIWQCCHRGTVKSSKDKTVTYCHGFPLSITVSQFPQWQVLSLPYPVSDLLPDCVHLFCASPWVFFSMYTLLILLCKYVSSLYQGFFSSVFLIPNWFYFPPVLTLIMKCPCYLCLYLTPELGLWFLDLPQ